MYRSEIAFYLGEQKTDGYSGVVFQDNLFFCIEVNSGISTEEGHKILDFIKERIKQVKIINLLTLDSFIVSIIKETNLPSGFSLASGFLKNNILYLKTAGLGQIFIRRKGKLGLLIEGNNTASGVVQDHDFFIFSTKTFIDLIGGSQELEDVFDHRSPTQIIEEITPNLKAKIDIGTVALFVNFHLVQDEEINGYESVPVRGEVNDLSYQPAYSLRSNHLLGQLKNIWFQMKDSKKTLTFIVVFFLFCIFLWSVILGYQRRITVKSSEELKLTKELVSQKLTSAQDVAFLNIDRAIILITESKEEVNKLKKVVGEKNKQIEELELMIMQVESKVLKKEQREYSEFFDLSVDDENVMGNKLYLDGEILYILDKKRGTIYQLSMEKKSLSKNQLSEIKSTDLIAGYENEAFFYVKDRGIYRIDDNGKLTKIIEKDSEWLDIKDMFLYNGNIYLLDKGQDEIWKHLRGEDQYSSSSSYFQSGQAIDLSRVKSLAIDGSIYLAGDLLIVKYTSGLRDGFSVDLPEKNNNFNKVIASKELEKVYLWDKNKGTVFVINKTGEYIEQINSEMLKNGLDLIVYGEQIYVLKESKIYKID